VSKRPVLTERDRVDRSIDLIASALNHAKAKSIKRITRQLERMSPKDVQTLECLIGKR
jgi:hypothetical protein